MIKAVIFDFGGVICFETVSKIYKVLAKKTGVDFEETRRIARKLLHKLQIGRMRENNFWKKLAKGLNSDPNKIKKIWLETFENNLRARKTVIKLALGLKSRGYIIAILSNAIKIHSDHVSRKNIYQLFSPVVLSFEVGMNKPNRNIYNLTARRIGLKANECLFIDDKEENVKVARSVGMHGIVFRNVTQLKTELKKVL